MKTRERYHVDSQFSQVSIQLNIYTQKFLYLRFAISVFDSGHFLRIRQWGGGGPSTKRDHTIPSVEK